METDSGNARKGTPTVRTAPGLGSLTTIQGAALVRTARHAIASHLLQKTVSSNFDFDSTVPGQHGIFVSLYDVRNHSLRGCIGDPVCSEPMLDVVQRAAVEAAVADYRFRPIRREEFDKNIVVEVNVLSPLESVWVRNPQDYVLNVIVGKDGLMVEGAGTRGLLLPQVAVEEGFDPEEFLCHCCMKAGLPPDSWLTGDLRIYKFQCQIFAEETPNGLIIERHVESSV